MIYTDITGPQINELLKINEYACSTKTDKIVQYTHQRYPASSPDQDNFDIYLYEDDNIYVFLGGNEKGAGFKTDLHYFSYVKQNKFIKGYENYSSISMTKMDEESAILHINPKYVTEQKYKQILNCVEETNIKNNLATKNFKYDTF